MKTINISYQVWVSCNRDIEVPDDYEIPEGVSGYALFEDLRKKYPNHEIWDEIPDDDGDGGIDIYDHLDYLNCQGLDIQKVFDDKKNVIGYENPYGFEYEIEIV